MKKLILIVLTLVLVTGLLTSCGTSTVPPIGLDLEKFVGLWVNQNQLDPIISKCEIELVNNYLIIEIWAKCGSTNCYWGEVMIDSNNVVDEIIEVVWEEVSGFGTYTQKLALINNQNLEIETIFYPYNPNSSVIKVTEYFKKV